MSQPTPPPVDYINAEPSTPVWLAFHVVFMSFGPGLLIPLAALIALTTRRPAEYRAFHVRFAGIAILLATLGVLIALSNSPRGVSTTHGVVGIVLFSLLLFHAAFARWRNLYSGRAVAWFTLHRFGAFLISFLTPLTMLLGYSELKNYNGGELSPSLNTWKYIQTIGIFGSMFVIGACVRFARRDDNKVEFHDEGENQDGNELDDFDEDRLEEEFPARGAPSRTRQEDPDGNQIEMT